MTDREGGRTGPSVWRLLLDEPASGARNMALDHALTATVGEDEGVLRLYSWARPTVSFGRNEPTLGSYSRSEAVALDIDFVRRPTGGRAVLHDAEVTYAVAVPERSIGGPRAVYRAVSAALVSGLRALAIDAQVVVGGKTRRPDAGPCFAAPETGEVEVEGRKVIGSAQARLDGALLQHGSVLLRGDQRRLEDLTARPGSGGNPVAVADLVAGVGSEELISALVEAFRRQMGGEWKSDGYRPSELEKAGDLERTRYACDDWTWRR